MRQPILVILCCILGRSALAQAFNLDCGSNVNFPEPSASFGGAAGQPGSWNPVPATPGLTNLFDVNGNATPVNVTRTPAFNSGPFEFNNAGTTGDTQNLMDDIHDPGTNGTTWSFSDLAAGSYTIYTYAWAPDNASFRSNVVCTGSPQGAQLVGGAWPGGFVQGTTHAVHTRTISAGQTISITITVGTTAASCNGFQIRPADPGTSFCVPGSGGVMACECGNPNGAGVGCANTGSSGGKLSSSGSASLAADSTDPGSLVLTGTSLLSGSTGIYLQGSSNVGSGATFGAGILCTGGNLKRMKIVTISGGSVVYPVAGDRSISNRSADLGDPLAAGATRYYQTYYRDPSFSGTGGNCPAEATFNVSSGQIIIWGP